MYRIFHLNRRRLIFRIAPLCCDNCAAVSRTFVKINDHRSNSHVVTRPSSATPMRSKVKIHARPIHLPLMSPSRRLGPKMKYARLRSHNSVIKQRTAGAAPAAKLTGEAPIARIPETRKLTVKITGREPLSAARHKLAAEYNGRDTGKYYCSAPDDRVS